jgi:predicted nuclease of restriction endonuclease-like (RecB) superfamily
MLLLDRAKDPAIRLCYLRAAGEHGWSRNILAHMLKGNLHEREGKALTNFERTRPSRPRWTRHSGRYSWARTESALGYIL